MPAIEMRAMTAVLAALSLLTGAAVGVLAQTSDDEAQPDLVPREVDTEDERPVDGETTRFVATVENDGEADAEAFNVTFLVDGEQLGENRTVDELRFGDQVEVRSAEWTAEADEQDVRVIVDPHDDVSEANETNNELARTVDVARAEADLAVTEVAWTPAEPVEGDAVTFSAQIENQGNVSANATELRFLVDGDALGDDVTVPALAPGENATLDSQNWTAQAGEHDVRAFVDPRRDVEEADETNNERQASLAVDPDQADLRVTEIALSPEHPEPGDDVVVTATVANDGHRSGDNVTVRFEIDGEEIANATLEHVAAGEEIDVASDPWNATEGEHTVQTIADPDDEVAEIDEQDNARERTVTVTERLPDLEATALTLPDGNVTEDEEVTFEATIANTGDETAEDVPVRFLVDGETVGSATLPTLAAGEDANVSTAWTAEDGEHDVRVIVDPDEQIAEGDETDNARQAALTVTEAEHHAHEHDQGDEEGEDTVTICHVPPGNPSARHTIEVGEPAAENHIDKHEGDHRGPCEDG